MLTIYKYQIYPSSKIINIPTYQGVTPLSCGLDYNGDMCIWAVVETEAPAAFMEVYCVGTGWPLDEIFTGECDVEYVGQIKDGEYIWHVFVEKEK